MNHAQSTPVLDPADTAATLEHFNGNHADTVLFCAQHVVGCLDAVGAVAVGADGAGLDFEVVTDTKPAHRERLIFDSPVETVDAAVAALIAAIQLARDRVGSQVPLTSLEAELNQTAELGMYRGAVSSTRRLTSNLREVTVAGLGAMPLVDGDSFIYLIAPRPGAEPVPADYSMAEYMAADPDTRPLGAYYTVRSFDLAAGTVTFWVVDHAAGARATMGHELVQADRGKVIHAWGPRVGAPNPPADRPIVLAVDESGFAAAAALVDTVPVDNRDRVLIIAECEDSTGTIEFGASTTWLFRHGAAPGTSGLLLAALRSVELDIPAGPWLFAAGESREVTALRRYARHDRGLSADDVFVTGYWRRSDSPPE